MLSAIPFYVCTRRHQCEPPPANRSEICDVIFRYLPYRPHRLRALAPDPQSGKLHPKTGGVAATSSTADGTAATGYRLLIPIEAGGRVSMGPNRILTDHETVAIVLKYIS